MKVRDLRGIPDSFGVRVFQNGKELDINQTETHTRRTDDVECRSGDSLRVGKPYLRIEVE